MSDNEPAELELGSTAYELFIGALSILSLVDIVLLAVLRDEATQTVVHVLDFVLSVVFLIDFLVRLHRARVRSDYFFRQFGWADLVASLPFPEVKILRVFRLVRVARLLRRYGAGTSPTAFSGTAREARSSPCCSSPSSSWSSAA